jgi:hypothetical protein
MKGKVKIYYNEKRKISNRDKIQRGNMGNKRKEKAKDRIRETFLQFFACNGIVMPIPNFIIISPAVLKFKHADR